MMIYTTISNLGLFFSQTSIALIAAFLTTYFLIPKLIKWAKDFNLLDIPDERKKHDYPIANLGGIGLVTGILVGFLILPYSVPVTLICSMALLLILGVVDDRVDLSAKKKFVIQIIIAAISIYQLYPNLSANLLPNYHFILQLILSISFGVFIVAMTNAYNLLDGIDGLAGGYALFAGLAFFGIFLFNGLGNWAFVSLLLSICCFGFLIYNFNPAKIFMGDGGSLPIGYLLAILGLEFVQYQSINPSIYFYHHGIIVAGGILLLPLFDTFRLSIIRIRKGKSPFRADRKHWHHLLLKSGFNHRNAALILYMTSCLLIASGFLIQYTKLPIALLLLFCSAWASVEVLTIVRIVRKWTNLKSKEAVKRKLLLENRFLKNL